MISNRWQRRAQFESKAFFHLQWRETDFDRRELDVWWNSHVEQRQRQAVQLCRFGSYKWHCAFEIVQRDRETCGNKHCGRVEQFEANHVDTRFQQGISS